MAVGLFNRGESANPVELSFKDIGKKGSLKIRDLWSHKDIGSFNGSFKVDVPRHGVALIRVQ